MRWTPSAAALTATLLALSVAPGAPRAQETPEAVGVVDLQARYDEAVGLARRGDVEEALAIFREVARTDPFWADAFYNVGSLSEHAGRAEDCALYFRRYLALAPDDPEHDAIERSIRGCEAAIPGSATLTVTETTPSDAHVAVDGIPMGDGRVGPLTLAAGRHTVTVSRADWIELSREVELAPGATEELAIGLDPVPLYGTVRFDVVQEGARVLIDGQEIGLTPLAEPVRLEVGDYAVEILKDGYHPWRRNIDVLRDLEDRIEVRLIDASVDLSRYGR